MSYVRRLAVWVDGPIKPLDEVTDYDVKTLGEFEVVEQLTDLAVEQQLMRLDELRLELDLTF